MSETEKDGVTPEEAGEQTEQAEQEQQAQQTEQTEELQTEAAEEAPADPTAALEEKVAALEEAAAKDKDRYLRLLAEFDNFRKRSIQEKDAAAANAAAKAALEIISVIDNFERAMDAECSDENYKKGVEMIYNQFTDVIKKLGVEEIDALGKPFDPNLHNAVSHTEDESFGENTVCQVYQKGYKLGDKVIRCAMVVVANP